MIEMNNTKYMIHTCLEREWYVNDYLIPSMMEQGIKRDNIEIWLDDSDMGNLISCMKCFEQCGARGSGRWHLQDDVCISSDFREKTEQNDSGVVCGFMHREWQVLTPHVGVVPAVFLWNSFQCIRIPDDIAGECAEWFFMDAAFRDKYQDWVKDNKYDDSFWHDFWLENHIDDTVNNLAPSIVDHVDFLLGGSVINKQRKGTARATLWEDDESVERLKEKLARRN